MEEKTYTPQEVCSELAKAIKAKIDSYGAALLEMRTRELRANEENLQKKDLCLICGNPDRPGKCTCVKIQKRDRTEAELTFSALAAKKPWPRKEGDIGGKEVFDAVKQVRNMPKLPHKPADKLGKKDLEMKPVGVPGKQPATQGGGDALGNISTAPKPLADLPGSTKPPIAKTTVPEANKELKGFQSLASNPTAMPGGKLATGSGKKGGVGWLRGLIGAKSKLLA